MIQLPKSIEQDLDAYKEKVAQYTEGTLDAAQFKPHGAAMGVYKQRNGELYMIRLRIPSGVITLPQLKKICELADLYAEGGLHFTTRQDIQLYHTNIEDTVQIMEAMLPQGIITKGAGGNCVRNVSCSPLSGVDKEEAFDVTPYGEAVTSYILQDPGSYTLPRKYKIAFSGSPADTANATIADLGFIAKKEGGVLGFEVYGAGGLGGSPDVSMKLEDFIPAHEILYHVQAMKNIFEREGDRTNRNKARIRYIRYRLGDEAFLQMYKNEIDKLKQSENMAINIEEISFVNEDNGSMTADSAALIEQKQKGYYSLYIHPQCGNISTGDMRKIINFIDNPNSKATIRLTSTQGLYVRDLQGQEADALVKVIEGFASPYAIEQSVVCTGAAICTLGILRSTGLMEGVAARFEDADLSVKAALPRLYISGCPNSCGQHQIGEIGLMGRMKKAADGAVPTYSVFLGGRLHGDGARLGSHYGDIPAKKVPDFLYELAEIKHRSLYTDFGQFVDKCKTEIEMLITQYGEIPGKEQEPGLYCDFE